VPSQVGQEGVVGASPRLAARTRGPLERSAVWGGVGRREEVRGCREGRGEILGVPGLRGS
jgi:hypothetical protein